MRRFDANGRDVTELTGLHDESDVLLPEIDEDAIVGRMVDQAMQFIKEGGSVSPDINCQMCGETVSECECGIPDECPSCGEMERCKCSPEEIERAIDTSGDHDGDY